MADPIEYLLQNILNPKLDATTLIVIILGVILFVLWTITYFFHNKTLQAFLFEFHGKLKHFIENRKTKSAEKGSL
jgi:hypothetical protein